MLECGSRVSLNSLEQAICRKLARMRYETDRKKNINDRQIGPQSAEQTDLEGVAAEFAFCKLCNLYPDLEMDTSKKSYDFILPDGRTIDIKSTTYRTGRLAVAPWKKPEGDLFGLMVGEFPDYTFRGVIDQSEAIRPERLSTLGHGKTYLVEQKELADLEWTNE